MRRTMNWMAATLIVCAMGLLLIMLIGGTGNARTIIVDDGGSGDYLTIQEAADNAQNGDTIEVNPGTYVENVRLHRELILKATGGMVTIDGRNDPGIRILANNTMVTGMTVVNASNGILAFNNSFTLRNTTIDNCTVYDGSDPGITLYHVNNGRISGCRSFNNSNDGIMLDHSANSAILNCDLYGNGRSGIYAMFSESNSIRGCMIWDVKDFGLYLWDSGSHSVEDCVLRNNRGTGVSISLGNGGHTITNCTVTNSTYYGIDIQSSIGNIIQNSTISYNNMTGINLYGGADSTIIDSCLLTGNLHGGIDIYSEDNSVSGCMIVGNDMNGLLLSDGHRNTIFNITVAMNGDHGIHLWGASENSISGCLSYLNRDSGLNFLDSFNNTIRNSTFTVNSKLGIAVSDTSHNNTLYHNKLIDNPQNARDNGTNSWDNGYPSGGNTWSDYDVPIEGASDSDGDGIADEPYSIPGTGANQDHYPIIPTDTISPHAVADPDREILPGTTVIFEGIESSDEVLLIDWIWTFTHNGTDQELHGYGASFTFWEVGTHLITLTVIDAAGNTDTDTMKVTIKGEDQNGGSKPEDDDEGSGFTKWLIISLMVIIILYLITSNMLKKDTEFKKKELESTQETANKKELKGEELVDNDKDQENEKGKEN